MGRLKKKKGQNLRFWLKLGRAGVWGGGVEGPTLLSGIFNPIKAGGDIASKPMHLVIQNFLTFPKYQKPNF